MNPLHPTPYHDPISTPRPTLHHSGKQSSKESRLYQWACLHGNSHEWAKQGNPGDGVNEKWSVAMEMCWMEGPHKQGYVMTGNSQHEVGVPIFNSEVQKYILIKLTIHLFPPLCLPPLFLPLAYNSTPAYQVSFRCFKRVSQGPFFLQHASLPGLSWYSFGQLLLSLWDQQYFQKPQTDRMTLTIHFLGQEQLINWTNWAHAYEDYLIG